MVGRRGALLSTIVLVGTLTACNDVKSPQGVIYTATQKVAENDIEGLRETFLEGSDAMDRYGDLRGMRRLRRTLRRHENPVMGEPQLIKTVKKDRNLKYEFYLNEVTGMDKKGNVKRLWFVKTVCKVERDFRGGGGRRPDDPRSGPRVEIERRCWISQID